MLDSIVRLADLVHDGTLEIGAGRPRTAGVDLPVLRVADVLDGRVQTTGQARDATDERQPLGSKVSRPGDIVLTTKGTVGRVAIMPVDGPAFAYSPQICYFRPVSRGRLDFHYLYYWLNSPDFRAQAMPLKSQTDMADFISLQDLFSFELQLPPLEHQRAIAEVLGALDDKIAANETEVDSAEALIVALVGRAQGTTQLAELAQQSTRTVRTSEFADRVAHFSLPAFDAAALPEIATGATIKSNKFLLDVPCVLVSKLNPRIPRIWDVRALPEQMSVASTEFVVLVPQGDSTTVLWAALSDPQVSTALSGLVAGTSGSHQRVKPSEMLQVEVPDTRTLSTTTRQAISCLGTLAHGRRIESQRIAATRNELLPLLMSGKIRVKDAEKATEGVL